MACALPSLPPHSRRTRSAQLHAAPAPREAGPGPGLEGAGLYSEALLPWASVDVEEEAPLAAAGATPAGEAAAGGGGRSPLASPNRPRSGGHVHGLLDAKTYQQAVWADLTYDSPALVRRQLQLAGSGERPARHARPSPRSSYEPPTLPAAAATLSLSELPPRSAARAPPPGGSLPAATYQTLEPQSSQHSSRGSADGAEPVFGALTWEEWRKHMWQQVRFRSTGTSDQGATSCWPCPCPGCSGVLRAQRGQQCGVA